MPPKLTPEYVKIENEIIANRMEDEHESTLRVIAACLDGQTGYKQHDRNRTFGEIAQHVFITGVFFAGGVAGGEFPSGEEGAEFKEPAPPTDKSALLAACTAMGKQAVDAVRALGPKQLMKQINFMGMCEAPGIEYLQWHLNHLIHHRGQLAAALRTMGSKVPGVYGPSADTTPEEMQQMMAEWKQKVEARTAKAAAPAKKAAAKKPAAKKPAAKKGAGKTTAKKPAKKAAKARR